MRGNPRRKLRCNATSLPSALSSTSTKPCTQSLTSTVLGASLVLRAKASSWPVSFAPRDAACCAFSMCRCARSSSIRLAASSRLPPITCNRLLKSCARPAVSCPMASIFCAWRRNCSVSRRLVTSSWLAKKYKSSPDTSNTGPMNTAFQNGVPSRR